MTLELTEQPTGPTYADLLVELGAEREMNELLVEAVSDLEIAAEDRGWRVASMRLEQEFSRQGLAAVVDNCRLMSIASPLVKRGVQLRLGYVWGQGVSIQGRAAEADAADGGQDVNAVVQAFWDDPSNQVALTSSEARETNERTLGTDGNLCFVLFPDPLTGRVQVRTTPFEEIQDKITNPDDRADVWFYFRQYTATVVEPGYAGTTRRRNETRRVLHPALGFWPAQRPKSIDGIPVVWDQPILHVSVNRPAHWKWGIPDVYAAVPWAKAYDGFLTDWAKLVKALSKFAWRLTGDRSTKARRAAERLTAAFPGRLDTEAALAGQGSGDVGNVAGMGPGVNLEAIPKSGATIDSGSGRPLAAMVAAALGVSVVDLLADPGVTGARAVAETMDKAIVGEMNLRRGLWTSVLQTILSYVIDQAVRAPRGPLAGTVLRDPRTGRETITLAGDVERTVEVKFPDLNELDPVKLVAAIVDADGTGKLPDKLTCKLLMQALRVDDVDELLDELFDEDGQWKDGMEPSGSATSAGNEAVRRFRAGEDPAAVLDPPDDPAGG
ncbi:hypothetical protein [Nocardioides sp. T2.26MG-1]|uniref:hypothetical protein n=1 Tax=Nocardioides sp. T2.26MG-1 TaxID=3041166 RepID=UPI0024777DCC|nr:hypothetical protein [Nocardioides sp. T2.26MG-1]CAI9417320.1 hypothetical protein HIDPHFAB_02990 [Nocardioides sp. T2.26MG-1]